MARSDRRSAGKAGIAGTSIPRKPADDAATDSSDSHPLDGSEADPWQAFVETAGPLRPMRKDRIVVEKPKPRARVTRDDERVMAELSSLQSIDAEDSDPIYRRADVHARVLRDLQRGRYAVQDEFDLHGARAAEVLDWVREFLGEAIDAGHRCVALITGRGSRSAQGAPVLRSIVAAHLRHRNDVIAFAPAPGPRGGAGVLWVLLGPRRQKHEPAEADV